MAKRRKNIMSPSEIRNYTFNKKILGGYKEEEVDAFKEKVANTVSSLLEQLKSLEGSITQIRVQLLECQEKEAECKKAKEKLVIVEGELEVLKKENEQLREKNSELESLVEALRMEIAEKEAKIEELKNEVSVQQPAEVIELAKKTADSIINQANEQARQIKERAFEEVESALLETFPEPLKDKIRLILEKAKSKVL